MLQIRYKMLDLHIIKLPVDPTYAFIFHPPKTSSVIFHPTPPNPYCPQKFAKIRLHSYIAYRIFWPTIIIVTFYLTRSPTKVHYCLLYHTGNYSVLSFRLLYSCMQTFQLVNHELYMKVSDIISFGCNSTSSFSYKYYNQISPFGQISYE